jgi:hypothetical protein
MVIEELTSAHPSQSITLTSFSNSSFLGCCSSPPPPGTTQALFCTAPLETYQFHNADYLVIAYYHYMIMRPPPQQPQRVDGNISIGVTFKNLTVSCVPKLLKWDPNNSTNRDTTFSYTLSSAQKKNSQVIIDIYNIEGTKIYETILTQLSPGTYTFDWDGTANQTLYPPNNIAPAGLYTFDITVNGKTPDGQVFPFDEDKMRSQKIKVSQTALSKDAENCEYYRFAYYLEGSYGTYPPEVNVKVYAPPEDNLKAYYTVPLEGGNLLGLNEATFPQKVIEVGGDLFSVVVSGHDNDLDNKPHYQKPLLERGIRKRQPAAAAFYAVYEWKKSGGGNEWIPIMSSNAEYWWRQCVAPVRAQLTEGAFKEPPNQNEPLRRETIFAPQWARKDTDTKEEILQITDNIDLALSALVNVDVFAYAGHGDGHFVEFVNFSEGGNYTQDYLYDSYILSSPMNFSNLHLVVIGTCRRKEVEGFPIVAALVAKGAKFGIGVGGISHRDTTPGDTPDWNILYADTYLEWAKRFWVYATEGYKKQGTQEKIYPTMKEAALLAMNKANDKLTNKPGDDRRVFLSFSGVDDYLGNIVY